MFEKRDGVIAAYPYGDSGTVEIHSNKADVVTEKSAKELIEQNKKFKVQSFEKRVVAKVKQPPEENEKAKRES
ncbi:MAG: hypothetical protein KDB80_06615 [Planctomycetes bacterium]|nr:hypothetical protein [Planctomycetota bacterium]